MKLENIKYCKTQIITVIALVAIIVMTIFNQNGLYMYLDGSYWPLTKEIALNNFLNELRSFAVNNGSSGYDKNLFTGTRILSSGIIYILVASFGIFYAKIIYLTSAIFLLIHSLYLVGANIIFANKQKAILFGIFLGVSGIFINSTNQIYLYTIPAIFYSLFFSYQYIVTGKLRFVLPLIISGYFLLGYIRYTMVFALFALSFYYIKFTQINSSLSLKKILVLGGASIIAFGIPILSKLYLIKNSIISSTASFSSEFSWYFPRIEISQIINYFYAFNWDRDFKASFIIGIVLGGLLLGFSIYVLISRSYNNEIEKKSVYLVLFYILLTLTIAFYKGGYLLFLKFLPFIQNQPLYLSYFILFFATTVFFLHNGLRILRITSLIGVLGFSWYWSSFPRLNQTVISDTISYNQYITSDNYNFVNTPTLYLPSNLLNYGDNISISPQDFTNFPSIGQNNSRLFFGNNHKYNKGIYESDFFNLTDLKQKTNIKLIKLLKEEYVIDSQIIKYIKNKKFVEDSYEKGLVKFIGEDTLYRYYTPYDSEDYDYFIVGVNNKDFINLTVYTNYLTNDVFLMKIEDVGKIRFQFLYAFFKNWKIKKVSNIPAEFQTEGCRSFNITKNSYCRVNNSLNDILYSDNIEDINYNHIETNEGRNIFELTNLDKDSYYILYYDGHMLKDCTRKILNYFVNP